MEQGLHEFIHKTLPESDAHDSEAMQFFMENNNLVPTTPTKKNDLKETISKLEGGVRKLYHQVPKKSPVRTTLVNGILEDCAIPERAAILGLSESICYRQALQQAKPINYYTMNLVS